MTTSTKDRAIIVHFSDRVWMGGVVDKKVTQAVREDNDVIANHVGHYWKRLLPKQAIRPRANAGNAARAWHLKNTLPWLDTGRILPVANLKEYTDGMRPLIAACKAEEEKLIKEYPNWIADAKRTHGKLFNENDYPAPEALADRFGIDINLIPMPNVSDWRLDLADDELKELQAQAQERFAAVAKEGIMDLMQRMMENVEHAKESLSDGEKTFRDSLINNIKETCKLVSKLNISNDAGLEALRKETEEKLANLSPATLRIAPDVRSKAAKDAGEIMRKMAAFMGGAKVQPVTATSAETKAPSKRPPVLAKAPAKVVKGVRTQDAAKPAKKALSQAQRDAKNKAARDKRAAAK